MTESIGPMWSPHKNHTNLRAGYRLPLVIGVKIRYAGLLLLQLNRCTASPLLLSCAGDRDSPRFVSIAKRPCLGRRRVAPTATCEIERRGCSLNAAKLGVRSDRI